MSNKKQTTEVAVEQADTGNTPVQGRSVFMVETIAGGVAVQTTFMTEQGQMLQMPAIFPNVDYAYAQIDELKRLVGQHFAQAAQVGAQVIAAQMAEQQSAKDNTAAKESAAATEA